MRALLILILAVFLGGCGMLEKWKERRKSKETTTTTITTTTTTTEKIDTTVKIRKDSVVAVRPLDDLIKGKPIEATDGTNTVRVTYDPASGNVRAVGITEPHSVPVTMYRTKKSDNRTDEVATKKEIVRTEQIERGSSGFQWGFMVAILAIIVLVALYVFYRRPRDGLIR